MGLTFDGLDIPGMVKPWAPDEWDLQTQTFSQFGQPGSGELDGGRTGRTLTIPVWLHDEYANQAALDAKLAAIEAKIGRIGTVVETSGVSATYTYCSLKSVARDKTGPLPPNSIGWSHHITLTFRQLRP